MTSRCSFHCSVLHHKAVEFLPKIALIAVRFLVPFFHKVDLSIMERRRRDLILSDKGVANIKFDVVLVSEMHLAMLDGKRAIIVHMAHLFFSVFHRFSPLLCFLLFVVPLSPEVCLDERSVLNHPLFDGVPLLVELPLKLLPDLRLGSRFFEPLSDLPDCREIRNGFLEAEKVAKGEPVVDLKLQFRIGKTVTFL